VQILGELNYRFIGLKSFLRMAEDERVGISLKNTAEYVAIVVPI
jgi:multiple sugar transport system permease protein